MGRTQDVGHVGLVFAALLNIRDEPIGLRQLPPGFEIVGRARRAAFSAGPDSMSASLAGRYWIVGRFRLDARDELRARLGPPAASASDAMLCLLAYAKWGESFTDLLAGDFAFVLWDDGAQYLLGVRDHMGVHALFSQHCRTAFYANLQGPQINVAVFCHAPTHYDLHHFVNLNGGWAFVHEEKIID